MTTKIETPNKEVASARALGDFYWTREGTESILMLVNDVAENGKTYEAWVCNVEFFDNGAFEVRGLKVAARQFEPNKTVLHAKTREDVEAALIAQCKAHVRDHAEIDARHERLLEDLRVAA